MTKQPRREGLPTPAERIDGALSSLQRIPPTAENAFLIATVELHLEKLREELGDEILYQASPGAKPVLSLEVSRNNMVTVHFDKPIAYLSMPPTAAVKFAKSLVLKATEAVNAESKNGR